MEEKLVTVRNFDEPMMAHLCMSYLEANDIETYLIDEHLTCTDWLYANATGGVKLQVKQSDVDKAIGLLRERESSVNEPEASIDASIPRHCPDCDSEDIKEMATRQELFVWAILSVLCVVLLIPSLSCSIVLGIPLIFWFMVTWVFQRRGWCCKGCGYSWASRDKPFLFWR